MQESISAYKQLVLQIEQMTKEDEDAEQELDLMEKLEKAPISSEKIAETVKNLEKRLEKDPKSRRSTIF
ncbi:hypothetical protein [Jeotgalibacillus soli]|nr:hypothetical protein [Jeotgalibacillus soli]